jgi:hypothetical protein
MKEYKVFMDSSIKIYTKEENPDMTYYGFLDFLYNEGCKKPYYRTKDTQFYNSMYGPYHNCLRLMRSRYNQSGFYPGWDIREDRRKLRRLFFYKLEEEVQAALNPLKLDDTMTWAALSLDQGGYTSIDVEYTSQTLFSTGKGWEINS